MKLLIVDDEKLLRNSLKKHFEHEGCQVFLAETAQKGLQTYREHAPNLTLLDVRLPDGEGTELLANIRQINPEALVILITAYGGIKSAVEAMRNGAQDYITKPFDIEELTFAVRKATEVFQLKQELRTLKENEARKYHFGNIITQSAVMHKVCDEALKVAQTGDATVMLRGESGTGKELLCRAIHYNSARRDHPLMVVNCASLPENLLESELFGYEKGAFTGAVRRKIGLLETADQGTVFLDEIGDVSPTTQVKLLRFLQDKEFYRVGGTKPVWVNARVVAATNRDLERGVKEGSFREDLYYRLHVFPIFIPPLRERKGDVPLLAHHILEYFNSKFGKNINGFSQEVMLALETYPWKGNVRELKNVIERSMILAEGQWILASLLPPEVRGIDPCLRDENEFPLSLSEDRIMPLYDLEALYIQKALDCCGGNKSLACRRLGITRQRLKRKMVSKPL